MSWNLLRKKFLQNFYRRKRKFLHLSFPSPSMVSSSDVKISPHFSSVFACVSPHLWPLQTPVLLMNKHRSGCSIPYTLETMFSFKVLNIAQSGFLNNICETALWGWELNNRTPLTSSSLRSSVSSCTNSTEDRFFLYVIFCLSKLCKPCTCHNCFKSQQCLTIHFQNKETAARLMLRIVNPKCGELIK